MEEIEREVLECVAAIEALDHAPQEMLERASGWRSTLEGLIKRAVQEHSPIYFEMGSYYKFEMEMDLRAWADGVYTQCYNVRSCIQRETFTDTEYERAAREGAVLMFVHILCEWLYNSDGVG